MVGWLLGRCCLVGPTRLFRSVLGTSKVNSSLDVLDGGEEGGERLTLMLAARRCGTLRRLLFLSLERV